MSSMSLNLRNVELTNKQLERERRVSNIRQVKERIRNDSLAINRESFFMSTLLSVTCYMLVLTLFLYATSFMAQFIGATGVGDGARFKHYVESGAFVDTGTQEGWSNVLLNIVGAFMGYALPTLSILSITFVMLSLICTVLYLFKQEYFDQVFLAKRALRECQGSSAGGTVGEGGRGAGLTAAANALNNITSNNAVQQYGFFKCYVMPNCKGIAFAEATDQPMSVIDFFKINFFKIILMFSFCIVISDQTMLNLFLRGAEVGTYVFKKAADVDYVAIIDGFATSGTDFKPSIWDTSTTEGKNKMKMYNTLYSEMKKVMSDAVKMGDPGANSTANKQAIGQNVVTWIESKNAEFPFSYPTFSVHLDKVGINSTQYPGSQRVTIAELGMGAFEEIFIVTVYAEQDTRGSSTILNITDELAWIGFDGQTSNEDGTQVAYNFQALMGPRYERFGTPALIDIRSFNNMRVYVRDGEGDVSLIVINSTNMTSNNNVTVEPMIEDERLIGWVIRPLAGLHIQSMSIQGVSFRHAPGGATEGDWVYTAPDHATSSWRAQALPRINP